MNEFDSWILPFTFIPGVAMMVLSTSNRLYYVTSMIREIVVTKNHIYANDVEKLLARIRHFHLALVSFYISIGLLAFSALVGNINRLWVLENAASYQLAAEIITSVGIVSVIFGTVHLVLESFTASKLFLDCKKTKEMIEKLHKDGNGK